VNVCFCSHGHKKGHVVNVFRLMGKHRGNPLTGLAVLLKFEGAFEDAAIVLSDAFEGLVGGEFLAVTFREFGLKVEGVHGAGPAVHEELDDTFYFGWMMESAI
jgi:hypothetical protein